METVIQNVTQTDGLGQVPEPIMPQHPAAILKQRNAAAMTAPGYANARSAVHFALKGIVTALAISKAQSG